MIHVLNSNTELLVLIYNILPIKLFEWHSSQNYQFRQPFGIDMGSVTSNRFTDKIADIGTLMNDEN